MLEQRLDDGSPGIVDQHHDVRRLQGRLLAHRYAGRQAVAIGPLRAANQFPRTRPVVERVEVEGDHKPSSPHGPTNCAFNEHESGRLMLEDAAIEVLDHASVDPRGRLGTVGAPELRLGQDEVECRRSITDEARGLLPVIGLGRVLIAGNHRPRLHGDICPGQQQRRHMQADLRKVPFHATKERQTKAGAVW